MRNRIAIILTALSVLSVMAVPAHADDVAVPAPVATGDYVVMSTQMPGRSISVSIRATGVLTSINTIQGVVECDVHGLPDGQRAEITQCVVSSVAGGAASAPSLSLLGPAGATAGTGVLRVGTLSACVTAAVNYGPLAPETLTINRCTSGVGDTNISFAS